jgi:hypothetical protein
VNWILNRKNRLGGVLTMILKSEELFEHILIRMISIFKNLPNDIQKEDEI